MVRGLIPLTNFFQNLYRNNSFINSIQWEIIMSNIIENRAKIKQVINILIQKLRIRTYTD